MRTLWRWGLKTVWILCGGLLAAGCAAEPEEQAADVSVGETPSPSAPPDAGHLLADASAEMDAPDAGEACPEDVLRTWAEAALDYPPEDAWRFSLDDHSPGRVYFYDGVDMSADERAALRARVAAGETVGGPTGPSLFRVSIDQAAYDQLLAGAQLEIEAEDVEIVLHRSPLDALAQRLSEACLAQISPPMQTSVLTEPPNASSGVIGLAPSEDGARWLHLSLDWRILSPSGAEGGGHWDVDAALIGR